MYTNNRSNSYVEDGVLYLQPTLSSDTFGVERVTGTVPFRADLWGMNPADSCTSNQFYGCERQRSVLSSCPLPMNSSPTFPTLICCLSLSCPPATQGSAVP